MQVPKVLRGYIRYISFGFVELLAFHFEQSEKFLHNTLLILGTL